MHKLSQLLILSFFLFDKTFSQSDTINKINPNGKKQGYWICYLDSQLKTTDKVKYVYYGYNYFEDGINLTLTGESDIKVQRIEYFEDDSSLTKPKLI